MSNEKRKGGKGLMSAAMMEPPPLAVEELQKLVAPLAAPVLPLPRGQIDAASAKLLLFDDVPAANEPRVRDRVLLVGLVWGGETLIELEQVPVGGELRAARLYSLPTTQLRPRFRIVQPEDDGHVVTLPAALRAEVHRAGRIATL